MLEFAIPSILLLITLSAVAVWLSREDMSP